MLSLPRWTQLTNVAGWRSCIPTLYNQPPGCSLSSLQRYVTHHCCRLEKLLTASVIISMSLTPLLAELASYVGDAVEKIDASGGTQYFF